jgi:hypothetical protein
VWGRKDNSNKDNPALKSSGAKSLINMETVPEVSETISVTVMIEKETSAETLRTRTAECPKILESMINVDNL